MWRFGAGSDEAKAVDARAQRLNSSSEERALLGHVGEVGPERRLAHDGRDDFGPRVADQRRAPTARKVPVLAPFVVPDARAVAAREHPVQGRREVELAIRRAGEHATRLRHRRRRDDSPGSHHRPAHPQKGQFMSSAKKGGVFRKL